MNENRLLDYLDHIRQAAADARSFVEGLGYGPRLLRHQS